MYQERGKKNKTSVAFWRKFFRWKKCCSEENNNFSNVSAGNDKLDHKDENFSCSMACIPSTTNAIVVTTYPPSPAISIPSKYKDVDHDMVALRLSRQDEPFLKVLTSKESLADGSVGESDAENYSGCSLLPPDVDPLSVPEFHKHMVRSPPPVSWPRSPVFRFDTSSQENLDTKKNTRLSCHCSQESVADPYVKVLSPSLNATPHSYRSSSAEAKDRRNSSSFSLFSPGSLRSLSEIRRSHATKGCEEGQQLVK